MSKKLLLISIMKKFPCILLLLISVGFSSLNNIQAQSDSIKQPEILTFTVGKTTLNKSLWAQPYRYENKDIKALTVQIIINPTSKKNVPLNLNDFILIDEEHKLRIRPNEVAYYRADKKIYIKSKAVNQNYNKFKETNVDGLNNFEAKTYITNFLGRKKRKYKPSIKHLKSVTIKGKKTTYYFDFPVTTNFNYGKIYFKNKPIGFAAIKK